MVLKSGEKLLGSNIATQVPQVEQGFIRISDRPGIGVDLVEDAEKIRPPVKRPVSMRHNLDGSPLDQ
jgi:galactonate dehydratase